MSDPSILKGRVRDLPPVFVETVNGISPDSNGEITLVVTTPVDPDSNNLLTSSVAGLMVDKRASEHSFDTVWTTLISTNVQWVINELDTRDISIQSQLWTAQGDISNLQSDLWSVTTRVTTAEWEIDTLQSDVSTLTSNVITGVSDTATMNLTKTGNNISADVMIKSDIHNLIESTPNGLYADNKAENLSYSNLATSIVSDTVQWAINEVDGRVTVLETNKLEWVSDTNSIDLTKVGTTISADIKIDSDTNNLISVTASGVFSDERAVAHTYDNTTSGLVATEVQSAIDELFSMITWWFPSHYVNNKEFSISWDWSDLSSGWWVFVPFWTPTTPWSYVNSGYWKATNQASSITKNFWVWIVSWFVKSYCVWNWFWWQFTINVTQTDNTVTTYSIYTTNWWGDQRYLFDGTTTVWPHWLPSAWEYTITFDTTSFTCSWPTGWSFTKNYNPWQRVMKVEIVQDVAYINWLWVDYVRSDIYLQ